MATSLTWNSQAGTSTGVIWALDNSAYGHIDWVPNGSGYTAQYTGAGPAVLYAYQALPDSNNKLEHKWDSGSLSSSMPGAVKFMMPTIADGRIFIAGGVPYYFATPSPAACPAGTLLTCAGQLTIIYGN